MSTIPGASGVPVTLTSGANDTATRQAIAVISSAATLATDTATYQGSPLTVSGANQLVVNSSSAINLNVSSRATPYQFFVVGDTSAAVTVAGGAALNQAVLLGTDLASIMTFSAAGGSGLIVAGDGRKSINTGTGTNFGVYTGAGADTINMAQSVASGRNTVSAGTGGNTVYLGAAPSLVQSTGADTIAVSAGSTTVQAGGSGTVSVSGGSGARTVITGAGVSTVFGGSGSATVTAGAGGGQFQGGTAGNNLLIGGSGGTYLTGAGNGDVLIATSTSQRQVLLAGSGNETLLGSLSTMDNVFEAGSGNDLIVAGSGNDTIYAGSGAATMTGGAGANVFLFNPLVGQGGAVTITDFKQGIDFVELRGYADQPAALAAAATHPTATSSRITLSDGTSITFLGVGSLSQTTFA